MCSDKLIPLMIKHFLLCDHWYNIFFVNHSRVQYAALSATRMGRRGDTITPCKVKISQYKVTSSLFVQYRRFSSLSGVRLFVSIGNYSGIIFSTYIASEMYIRDIAFIIFTALLRTVQLSLEFCIFKKPAWTKLKLSFSFFSLIPCFSRSRQST